MLSDLAGLSRRAPLLGFMLAVSAFSLAGIPPTGGFIGKFFLFWWVKAQDRDPAGENRNEGCRQIGQEITTIVNRSASHLFNQSFFVPSAALSKKSRKDGEIVFSAVPARKRFPDRRFICRAVVEHGVRGVRVWRVAEE
jgi:hypothetical protein